MLPLNYGNGIEISIKSRAAGPLAGRKEDYCTMSDLDERELAQQGLKNIEDAIVGLLTRHPQGLSCAQIAEMLGLHSDFVPEEPDLVAAGILTLLAKSGRILWDGDAQLYKDNPDMT